LRQLFPEAVMMPRPRTRRFRLILAAVDFSPQSAHALRYAVAMARASGGRVVAFHAVDPLLGAALVRAYAEGPLIRETKEDLRRFVRKTLGAGGADAVECSVVVGPARQALMTESARRRPDVVVMGTNARRGIAKIFFGSTTEAMLRRYHGTILVVPPHCPDPGETWPDGKIVAAIPNGPHRRAALSAATRTADIFGGWLTTTSPGARLPRSSRRRVPLLVLPLPEAARLRTFRQGTTAYEFVRRAPVPVLVTHSGHPIGHAEPRHTAA
jgi:nucleotide-binding universal stress UspA family protein